ncbi:MAG: hypothetical protein HUU38_27585 [Anaerolineales bacterium]|nr:hypothetical protein [Anaerolineales bacterium]
MLTSIQAYSQVIYEFLDSHPRIQQHTVRIYLQGATVGILEGEVVFEQGIILFLYERLDFLRQQIMLYSYEVRQRGEKLYWYDPQPHPENPALAVNFPHHKHTPPDIKHHRISAPDISFTQANLPFLVAEIERMIAIG